MGKEGEERVIAQAEDIGEKNITEDMAEKMNKMYGEDGTDVSIEELRGNIMEINSLNVFYQGGAETPGYKASRLRLLKASGNLLHVIQGEYEELDTDV